MQKDNSERWEARGKRLHRDEAHAPDGYKIPSDAPPWRREWRRKEIRTAFPTAGQGPVIVFFK